MCVYMYILMTAALLSIWQQPNQRGEEHEEPHTSEGKCYPDGETEIEITRNSMTTSTMYK